MDNNDDQPPIPPNLQERLNRTDARLDRLTQMLEQLLAHQAQQQPPPHAPHPGHYQHPVQPANPFPPPQADITRRVKVDPPTFDGMSSPKEFSDWLLRLENAFEWHNLDDADKVRYAKQKLIGRALISWMATEPRFRTPEGVDLMTWPIMKAHLQAQYIPRYHRTRMFDELTTLSQGLKTVSDYYAEMQELLVRCQVDEMPEITLARFKRGLRHDIRHELMRYGDHDLEQTYSIALDVESHLGVGSTKSSTSHSSFPPKDSVRNTHVGSKPGERLKGILGGRDATILSKEVDDKTNEKIPLGKVSRANITCYACREKGHISRDCPKQKLALTITAADDEYFVDEEDLEEEEGIASDLEEDRSLLVLRRLLSIPSVPTNWERTSIFSLNFKSGDKWCKLIIDSGSCLNVISTNAVNRMKLKAEPHPNPYNVTWVDKSSIPVTHRCLVPLCVKDYKDEIWCDVMPMEVCHLILGRPWLYDRDVTYFGRANVYEFNQDGRKIRLKPSPPPASKVREPVTTSSQPTISIMTKKEFVRGNFEDGILFALVQLQDSGMLGDLTNIPPPNYLKC